MTASNSHAAADDPAKVKRQTGAGAGAGEDDKEEQLSAQENEEDQVGWDEMEAEIMLELEGSKSATKRPRLRKS